jgi:hypothetical protein
MPILGGGLEQWDVGGRRMKFVWANVMIGYKGWHE